MWRLIASLVCAGTVLTACAPGPVSPGQQGGGSQPASTGAKTLRFGLLQEEPSEGIALFSSGGNGAQEPAMMFHAGLTNYDERGNIQARLALKVPSIDDGDWRVASDGTMEVTWKLKPNLAWHDGTPLVADDFVFGLQIYKDDAVPITRPSGIKFISDVSAPDPQTFVVRYKQPFADANVGGFKDIPAVPRHIIGDLHQSGDKQAFINSPYWAREFVGVGPYRLGQWVVGSYIEALAFDQYVLGRPKIDRVLIKYFSDVNTLVANVLTREIDFVPVGSLKLETGNAIKDGFPAIGGGTVRPLLNKFREIELQWRDPSAPWVRDLRVRQALAHLIDRQSIVDTLMLGLTTTADVPIAKEDPAFAIVEQRGYPKYPYDVARATQLLADAGWTKGPDGMLRSPTEDRFSILVGATGTTGSPEVREAIVLADQWRGFGLDSSPYIIDEDASNRDELRANTKGGVLRSPALQPVNAFEIYTSGQIATAASRWRGSNRMGYTNPELDRVYEQWSVTLEVPKRRELVADMAKLLAEDVPYLPMYYGFDVMASHASVQGPTNTTPFQPINAWNIHAWDLG